MNVLKIRGAYKDWGVLFNTEVVTDIGRRVLSWKHKEEK